MFNSRKKSYFVFHVHSFHTQPLQVLQLALLSHIMNPSVLYALLQINTTHRLLFITLLTDNDGKLSASKMYSLKVSIVHVLLWEKHSEIYKILYLNVDRSIAVQSRICLVQVVIFRHSGYEVRNGCPVSANDAFSNHIQIPPNNLLMHGQSFPCFKI